MQALNIRTLLRSRKKLSLIFADRYQKGRKKEWQK
jgi:hypothetical protein